MDKLLSVVEARFIRDALCTMNALGTPFFQTAVTRVDYEKTRSAVVFTWRELNDPQVMEVVIHTTDMIGPNVRVSYRSGDLVEVWASQNAFFDAYGVND